MPTAHDSNTQASMTDATGRITSVSTIARDITSQKQAETAVRDERDRAQQYLDTAEVILLELDAEGRIILVNRYACTSSDGPRTSCSGATGSRRAFPSRIRECTPKQVQEP